MATKTPNFQEQVTPRDVNMRVFQPPVDKSTAQMIEAAGNTIVGAYKGKVEADLETGIDSAVNDFLTGAPQDTAAVRAATEQAGGAEQLLDQVAEQEEGMTFTDVDKELSAVPEAAHTYSNKLIALERAAQQSRITPTQLKIRVEALTREAISTLPGFANEFRRLAAARLGDYSASISAIESDMQASQKAALKSQEALEKEAYESGVPLVDIQSGAYLEPSYYRQWSAISRMKAATRRAEAESELIKSSNDLSRESHKPLFDQTEATFATNVDNEFIAFLNASEEFKQAVGLQAITNIVDLQNVNPKAAALATTLFDSYANNKISARRQQWSGKGLKAEDFTRSENALLGYKNGLVGLLDGSLTAKAFSDASGRRTDSIILNLPDNIATKFAIFSKMRLPVAMEADLAVEVNDYLKQVSKMTTSEYKPGLTATPDKDNDAAVISISRVVDELSTMIRTGDVPKGQEQEVQDIVDALANGSANPQNLSARSLSALNKVMANPSVITLLNDNFNPEVRANIEKVSRQMAVRAIQDYNRQIQTDLSGPEAALVQLEVDERQGRVFFAPRTGIPAERRGAAEGAAVRWNRTHATPINEAIRSFAHANGNERYAELMPEVLGVVEVPQINAAGYGQSTYTFFERIGKTIERAGSIIGEAITGDKAQQEREKQALKENERRQNIPIPKRSPIEVVAMTSLQAKVAKATTAKEKLDVLTSTLNLSEEEVFDMLTAEGLNPSIVKGVE